MTWDIVARTRNRLPGERPVRVAGPFETWAQAVDHLAQFGPENGAPRRLSVSGSDEPEGDKR